MAYSVYAVAAAEFMAAFYESLFAGDSVGQAVTAGRKRLFEHDGRPSPKGDMPLADWLVPVHYLRREVRFPDARTTRPAAAPSLDAALDQIRAAAAGGRGARRTRWPRRTGVFVGRDDLFYQLETAARLQRVVVLAGPGGTGKTELAKGFARWWRDTGGVDDPRLVLWHSFEPGVASFGLDGVITAIGLAVFGADFARLDAAAAAGGGQAAAGAVPGAAGVGQLRVGPRRCPTRPGRPRRWTRRGCARLREFLDWVRDHSRQRGDHHQPGAGGLAGPGPPDRGRRAEPGRGRRSTPGYLLAPYPAARQRRERRSFGELLDWLDGHPLAMRLTLPRLDTTDPADLLAGLRGTAPCPAERRRAGPAVVAGGVHHLLLRPPVRAGQAAAPGGQPVPRHRRRERPDALLRRRGGAGPVRRDQQRGVDGGAGRTRPGSGC